MYPLLWAKPLLHRVLKLLRPQKFQWKEALAPKAELTSVLSADLGENSPVLLFDPRKTHEDTYTLSAARNWLTLKSSEVYFCICDCFMPQLLNPARQRETAATMQSITLSPWTNLKCIHFQPRYEMCVISRCCTHSSLGGCGGRLKLWWCINSLEWVSYWDRGISHQRPSHSLGWLNQWVWQRIWLSQ